MLSQKTPPAPDLSCLVPRAHRLTPAGTVRAPDPSRPRSCSSSSCPAECRGEEVLRYLGLIWCSRRGPRRAPERPPVSGPNWILSECPGKEAARCSCDGKVSLPNRAFTNARTPGIQKEQARCNHQIFGHLSTSRGTRAGTDQQAPYTPPPPST